MSEVATLRCVVHTLMQSYSFAARVHRSETPAEQKIEPEFYIRWAKKEEGTGQPHEGVHHELELIDSPAYERVHPDVPIHAHKNPNTGVYYVCYTGPVRTMEHATDLFRQWCVGTAFAVEKSEDFAPIISEHPDDFLEFMDRHHGYQIAA